jgi:hypothetical protein
MGYSKKITKRSNCADKIRNDQIKTKECKLSFQIKMRKRIAEFKKMRKQNAETNTKLQKERRQKTVHLAHNDGRRSFDGTRDIREKFFS